MSRSYWVSVFATLGIALWSHAPYAQGVPAPSPTPQEQTGATSASGQPSPPGIPVTIIETPEQAISRDAAAKEGREHDAKDLDAQIRAADAGERGATAAERQIIPTWLGAFLSLVGTGLVVWSLFEARRGNRIALQAVEQEQANARIQARAYVGASDGGIALRPNDSLKVGVTIKNVGQTPAANVKCWLQITTSLAEIGPPVIAAPDGVEMSELTIGSGNHVAIKIEHQLRQGDIDLIRNRQMNMWVGGTISYVDVFGSPHTTTVMMKNTGPESAVFEGKPNVLGWSLRAHSSGNNLT